MAKKETSESQDQETQDQLRNAVKTLGIISRTLGVLAIRLTHTRPKTEGERVFFLNSLGFDRNEIAAILAGDPETISVHLSQQLKSKKKRGSKRGKN